MLEDVRRHNPGGSGCSALVLVAFIVACFAVASMGAWIPAPQTTSGGWYY